MEAREGLVPMELESETFVHGHPGPLEGPSVLLIAKPSLGCSKQAHWTVAAAQVRSSLGFTLKRVFCFCRSTEGKRVTGPSCYPDGRSQWVGGVPQKTDLCPEP